METDHLEYLFRLFHFVASLTCLIKIFLHVYMHICNKKLHVAFCLRVSVVLLTQWLKQVLVHLNPNIFCVFVQDFQFEFPSASLIKCWFPSTYWKVVFCSIKNIGGWMDIVQWPLLALGSHVAHTCSSSSEDKHWTVLISKLILKQQSLLYTS